MIPTMFKSKFSFSLLFSCSLFIFTFHFCFHFYFHFCSFSVIFTFFTLILIFTFIFTLILIFTFIFTFIIIFTHFHSFALLFSLYSHLGVGKTHSVRTAIGIANLWHPQPPPDGGGGGGGAHDVSNNAMRLVSIRGLELLLDFGSHTDAVGELRRAFKSAPSWVASSRTIGGGSRRHCHRADGVEGDKDGECGGGGREAPRGCAHHIAVIWQRLLCSFMSATLLSSLAVIAAKLAAILNGMEVGGVPD